MVALLWAAVAMLIFTLGVAAGVLLLKLPVPVEPRPDVFVAAPIPVTQAPSAAPAPSAVPLPSPAPSARSSTAAAAPPVPDPSGIAAERSLLTDADDALRHGQVNAALAAVDEHARRWHGGGHLAKEREHLRFRALIAAGRVTEARASLESFAQAHPGDPMVRAWQQQLSAAR